MWIIDRVQSLRIVPGLWMRDIEKPHHSPAISADIFIGAPLIFIFIVIIVTLALVVWLVVSILVERVLDAFVEDFFGVIGSIRPFCPRNGVGKAEIV